MHPHPNVCSARTFRNIWLQRTFLFLEVGDYSEESPNKIKEEEKKTELRNAQKEIEDDPNVQSLVEAFGAKVIESSIEPRTEK